MIQTRVNQRISLRTKSYHKSIIRTRENQKVLSSMKVIRRKSIQKALEKVSTQIRKNSISETYHEEPLVTGNIVTIEPIYFNLFKCDTNILNRLDATCKRACMATSRYRYYTEKFKTRTD